MNAEQTKLFTEKCSIFGQKEKFYSYIEKNRKMPMIGTGWPKLDDKLNGGIMPGLYCLGAISSLGKTAFSLQLASSLAKQGYYVLYFTIEMSQIEMMARTISQITFMNSPVDYKDYGTLEALNGYKDNEDLFKVYSNEYFNKYQRLSFIEGDFDMSVKTINNKIQQFISDFKHRPIVFVDYLQLVDHGEKDSNGNDRYLNDKQSIDIVTKSLKKISRNHDIPIWLISSFNRQSYKSPVSFECFKESGIIEYTSDVLMGLQLSVLDGNSPKDKDKINEMINNAKSQNPREITLVILKQRNGKSYIKQKFKFYPKNNFFCEV